jgi:hypothetical protein
VNTFAPTTWLRLGRKEPCPICGHLGWCTKTADGAAVKCMRVESSLPILSGGWVHRLTATPLPRRSCPPRRQPAPPGPTKDWPALMATFADTGVPRLAADLGVADIALWRLGTRWAATHQAWAFPMYDGHQEMIGVRLRADNGRKWAVTGSRNGLFWPTGLATQADLLIVCEGPTDTAALLGLGFDVIGRPQCNGLEDLVIDACRRLRPRDVVILADFDEPKPRPDGTTFRPGQDGARRLADALTLAGRRPRIILPLAPHKDARAWVRAGATRETVLAVIKAARYHQPRKEVTP